MKKFSLIALAALVTATAVPAFAQNAMPQPVHVRGTIVSADAMWLTVDANGVTKKIALGAKTGVALVVPAKLTDVKTGAFIGTAATPQSDGTFKAQEVVIFPEAMRGMGEGHYPWDLGTGSTMTNGTIGNSETAVTGVDNRVLTVTYKGGTSKVAVPKDAPIVTFAPGTPAALVKGAHVFIVAIPQADGSLAGAFVAAGKGDTVPPM
jgi:hypothetical protein